jgi:collagenase-like PrtC family protease
VGLNGSPNNIERILDRYGNDIYEVFIAAPPQIYPTGRWKYSPVNKHEIKRQVALAHKYKVRYNVLMNGACAGGRQFSSSFQKKIIDFVKFLDEIKTDSVTLVDPFLMDLIRKHSDIHIIAGNSTQVSESIRAQRLVARGVNRIVLHQNVNRNFEMLKKNQRISRYRIGDYPKSGMSSSMRIVPFACQYGRPCKHPYSRGTKKNRRF